MAVTTMRSISSCLWTKNRPSDLRNRLMRVRSSSASSCNSSSVQSTRTSATELFVGAVRTAMLDHFLTEYGEGNVDCYFTVLEKIASYLPRQRTNVAVDALADKIFVLVEPTARLSALCEIVAYHG